ncbi:inosine monophosphate dehydrogenase [Daldinia vernicosa]|uniref:inosine monophosphate dehydrogenase n=1 Tax=Daldinia vernicosa TaxID=114800 RepID=UPI002007F6A4|nr:inosine monophosphate dehydrogenase [Daldinia vernicosa]KAI0844523.1 inosine monophosphate dehydrogenase [Daldinia vernicosa]
MTASRMKSWFPTTASPLIISAPMAGVTNIKLAAEVTKAGGLGFIQAGRDFNPDSPALKKLDDQLTQAWQLLDLEAYKNDSSHLPIGVGALTFMPSAQYFAETVVPILKRHRPAAIWLFAPSPKAPDTHSTIVKELRSRGGPWNPKIVVQVGTVAAAREAAAYGADIIVAQGVDAGGHQWAKGAGIVSIVPEVIDMLREEFPDKEIPVWAAGGIADGRGVAAALALGAEGAVLGTRYMVATESDAQDYKRKAVITTSDGGSNTVKIKYANNSRLPAPPRSQVHDHITGEIHWPEIYDGRAIVTPTYHDHVAGVPLDENAKRLNAAKDSGDVSRLVTWSGTGVGLVKKEQPAADITREVRDEALKAINSLKSFL